MADTASHSELIAKFTGVTGVDAERAKFYLESSAWHLDVALGSFYEDGDDNPGMDADDDEPEVVMAPRPAMSQPKKSSQKPPSRFGTISGLQQGEDSSEEEDGQAFYAGGSEHSGQQVLGPPKKKVSPDELVQNMFKAAKEHGAETVEAGSSQAQAAPRHTFHGTGYRLGDTPESSERVVGGPSMQGPRQIDVILKLWKNGFSIDDGEIRSYHDPANKEFLDSIHRGEVPRELLRLARGGEVNLNMEDHRTEEYVQPKVKVKAFTGEGHMLGSPAPSVPAASDAPASTAATATEASVKLDESQPTTNVQIRLSDGSRMVGKFNHTHTIADIRQYILDAHPRFAGSTFVLMTTFPNKELTNETLTLKDAQLLNAVLVQRMK